MSKRHQASRRRSYGRRLHEIHERPDLRAADGMGAGAGGEDREADVARAAHVGERLGGRYAFEFID